MHVSLNTELQMYLRQYCEYQFVNVDVLLRKRFSKTWRTSCYVAVCA